jgi:hypothetical protein
MRWRDQQTMPAGKRPRINLFPGAFASRSCRLSWKRLRTGTVKTIASAGKKSGGELTKGWIPCPLLSFGCIEGKKHDEDFAFISQRRARRIPNYHV